MDANANFCGNYHQHICEFVSFFLHDYSKIATIFQTKLNEYHICFLALCCNCEFQHEKPFPDCAKEFVEFLVEKLRLPGKEQEELIKRITKVKNKKYMFWHLKIINLDTELSLDLRRHHRRLPLEMECEIFKFLKTENQQKFICGMGRGIYGIFRLELLIKVNKNFCEGQN
jgi:hypothetical protein